MPLEVVEATHRKIAFRHIQLRIVSDRGGVSGLIARFSLEVAFVLQLSGVGTIQNQIPAHVESTDELKRLVASRRVVAIAVDDIVENAEVDALAHHGGFSSRRGIVDEILEELRRVAPG